MITINVISDKLEKSISHSHPFIGTDELGGEWFVKTYLNESGHEFKALFNEYVAFKLAEKIELPWPKGHVVQLSENVRSELKISTSCVIAYEFIHDIKELPENYQYSNDQLSDLYGKSIFDNWLSIGDVKNDTCKLLNDKLLFMDAGIAFVDNNGSTWGEGGLIWTPNQLFTESSPYHCGNIHAIEGYSLWMNRICEIPVDYYQSIVDSIPQDWHVPESYKSKFVEVFSSSCESFIPMMTDCIEWELNSQ
ncbi:HipA family kinase [Citrobacter werkmanii]|uniref:HipA family kinase n=1 Tax=Citrobacter werkmanii TaxID=67827 RepID=UPI00351D7671